jgi:predicted negative regulator of RcsB-dependent stress response
MQYLLRGDEFMRSKNVQIFCSLILALLMVIGWTVYGQRSAPQRSVWEYKVVHFQNEQQLNELGSQGWEMVTATGDGGYFAIYLKRAK